MWPLAVLDPASIRELFYFDQSDLLAKLDREAVTQRAFADSNSNMGAEYGGDGSASGRGNTSGGSGSGSGSVTMAPLWSADNRPFVTQRAAHSCVFKSNAVSTDAFHNDMQSRFHINSITSIRERISFHRCLVRQYCARAAVRRSVCKLPFDW
jgi:hypothetical protein